MQNMKYCSQEALKNLLLGKVRVHFMIGEDYDPSHTHYTLCNLLYHILPMSIKSHNSADGVYGEIYSWAKISTTTLLMIKAMSHPGGTFIEQYNNSFTGEGDRIRRAFVNGYQFNCIGWYIHCLEALLKSDQLHGTFDKAADYL